MSAASAKPAASTVASPAGSAAVKPAASASAKPAASARGGQLTTVKFGSQNIVAQAADYIADAKGYFKDAGLQVQFIGFKQGAEMSAPLATGELNFASLSIDVSIFNAILHGVDLRVVSHDSLVTPTDQSAAFIVRKDLVDSGKYKTPADFKGMTMATNGSVFSAYWVEKALGLGKLKPSDVTLKTVGFPDQLVALTNKSIDASYEVEPFVGVAQSKGIAVPQVRLNEIGPGLVTTALVISPVFAKDHPDAAKAFVLGHVRGLRYYYHTFVKGDTPQNKDEIYDILAKYTGVKDVNQIKSIGMHGALPNGEVLPQVIDEVQQYFLRTGLQTTKLDYDKVVNNTYLDYAIQQLGKEPE